MYIIPLLYNIAGYYDASYMVYHACTCTITGIIGNIVQYILSATCILFIMYYSVYKLYDIQKFCHKPMKQA